MSALCFWLSLPKEVLLDGSNIHETCPAFWAPPLVAAEEVLLDMAAALVVGFCSRCRKTQGVLFSVSREDFCPAALSLACGEDGREIDQLDVRVGRSPRAVARWRAREWLCRYYRAARRLRLSGHREKQRAVEAFLGPRGRQCRHFVRRPPCFGPRPSPKPTRERGPAQGPACPRSEVIASQLQTFQTLAAVLL